MIHRRRRPVHVIILVAAFGLITLPGRGLSRAQESPGGAPAIPASKLLGVWQGATLASCAVSLLPDRCNAQQKVSITVVAGEAGKPSGFYKCAYGTQNCLHLNESGKVVEATSTGDRISIRVIMPDGLSYMFSGRLTGDTVNGGYTCYNGGAPLERGNWRARRVY